MKISKLSIFIIICIIASIIGTVVVYPYLPDIIPTHWGITGEIDGYSEKWAVFIIGGLPIVMFLLFKAMPYLDPKKENYKLHEKAYNYTISSVILFIIAMHWVTIAANFYNIDVVFWVRILMGILFIVIGNYTTQFRFNYFAGIRTPWTLADETVWKKTHRVGGYAFMLSGILTLITIPFNHMIGFIVMFASIIVLLGYTMIYSYLEYKKVKKEEKY